MSDTRVRVLDAALACLVANGFGGTTARAIAQAGGFAPGVIYYHFADLDDLLVATLAHTCEARAKRYRAELSGVAVDLHDGQAGRSDPRNQQPVRVHGVECAWGLGHCAERLPDRAVVGQHRQQRDVHREGR